MKVWEVKEIQEEAEKTHYCEEMKTQGALVEYRDGRWGIVGLSLLGSDVAIGFVGIRYCPRCGEELEV